MKKSKEYLEVEHGRPVEGLRRNFSVETSKDMLIFFLLRCGILERIYGRVCQKDRMFSSV